MNQQKSLLLRLELIWWALTLVILIGVLYPIYNKTGSAFPFYGSNSLFIIIFITFTRLIFLIKHSFLASFEKLKIGLIAFSPILIFLLINEINTFQAFLDEEGIEAFLKNESLAEQTSMRKYITSEMLFFGVGSIIAVIILPFSLLISIWRKRNTDSV